MSPRWALTAVVGVMVASTAGLVLGTLRGVLGAEVAAAALLAGATAAAACARAARGGTAPATGDEETRWVQRVVTVVAGAFAVRHSLWLLFPAQHRWWTLNPNNLGDLPLHLSYIRALSRGEALPLANPSFAGEPLRYPLGMDLFNALLDALGLPLTGHLFLASLGLSLAALAALRWAGGWWMVAAFFFSGGLSGWAGALRLVPWTAVEGAVQWKNLVLAVLTTQRGFLVALPAGVLVLEVLRRHLAGPSAPAAFARWTGLAWGLLPLFHLHSFVAVSLLVGAQAAALGRPGLEKLWTSPSLRWALGPGTVLVVLGLWGAPLGAVHLDAFWTFTWPQVLWEVPYNFGPWLLLPAALLWRWPALQVGQRAELLAALGLGGVFFHVMLAPWAWDNVKVLVWPALALARLASEALPPLLPRGGQVAAAVVLCLSGTVSLAVSWGPPLQRGQALYRFDDLASTESATRGLPRGSVFAAAPTHDHPLTSLGRPRVVGYPGHLWSHGIDGQERLRKLDALMRGAPGWRALARELGATHIIWGRAERETYGAEARPPFLDEAPNLSAAPDVQVHAVADSRGDAP